MGGLRSARVEREGFTSMYMLRFKGLLLRHQLRHLNSRLPHRCRRSIHRFILLRRHLALPKQLGPPPGAAAAAAVQALTPESEIADAGDVGDAGDAVGKDCCGAISERPAARRASSFARGADLLRSPPLLLSEPPSLAPNHRMLDS